MLACTMMRRRADEGARDGRAGTSCLRSLWSPLFRTRAPTENALRRLGGHPGRPAARLECRRGLRLHVHSRSRSCGRELDSYQPDIVGIYSMVSLTRNTLG